MKALLFHKDLGLLQPPIAMKQNKVPGKSSVGDQWFCGGETVENLQTNKQQRCVSVHLAHLSRLTRLVKAPNLQPESL